VGGYSKKKKEASSSYTKKKKKDEFNNEDMDNDTFDYFDLYYYSELESLLSPLLYRIQFGPVFKNGLSDDIINYIKNMCNLKAINHYYDCDSE
jgi:hypothetical protein